MASIKNTGVNLVDSERDIVSSVDSGSESNLGITKDDAYDVYKQHEDVEITEEESKRVLRIIDIRVMPLLFLMYALQYLDKNACLKLLKINRWYW
jgi:hypothetical protein